MQNLDHSLLLAIQRGDANAVKSIFREGADVSGAGHYAIPLRRAIEAGHHSVLGALLKCGADPNGGQGAALVSAAEHGDLASVTALLDAGADPFLRDSGALQAAVRADHPEIVGLLLTRGAPVDPVGMSLFKGAGSAGTLPIIRRLLAAAPNCQQAAHEVLISAAVSGHVHVFEALLHTVDPADNVAETALYLAAHHDHRPLMEYLFAAGADTSAVLETLKKRVPVGATSRRLVEEASQAAVARLRNYHTEWCGEQIYTAIDTGDAIVVPTAAEDEGVGL